MSNLHYKVIFFYTYLNYVNFLKKAATADVMLKAIEAKYGYNFTKATNGLVKVGDYPTNYSPMLR